MKTKDRHKNNIKLILGRIRCHGLSLLEVIIALTILSVSVLGIISVFRNSGTKAESFSSERFTAMFLAQKIIEDINFRCTENPYFFDQIIASVTGELKEVVSSGSEYFDMLGNTKNFTSLERDEDKSFTDNTTSIYNQLKRFKYRVESKFVPDKSTGNSYPNLVDVTVYIYWKEKSGKDNVYTISQRIHGTSQKTFTKISDEITEPFTEDNAGEALWDKVFPDLAPSSPLLASYMSKNGGGDRKIVEALGHLMYIKLIGNQVSDKYDNKISQKENEINSLLAASPIDYQSLAESQEELAQLYEQEGSRLFIYYAKLLSSIDTLHNSTLNKTSMGSKLYSGKASISGLCWSAIQTNNQMIMCFAGAQKAYIQLLKAPYKTGIDKRRETEILRNLIAIEKLEILLRNPLENVTPQLTALRKQLEDFKTTFKGKQPIFVDYLNEELKICKNMSSLCGYYGGSSGLNKLIIKMSQSRKKLFKIEDKL